MSLLSEKITRSYYGSSIANSFSHLCVLATHIIKYLYNFSLHTIVTMLLEYLT